MMRGLVAVALCLSMATAAAQSGLEKLLIPSPWTIGIMLVDIFQKEQRKIVYVEVVAQGRDLKDAQAQALRMAVERAVGSVVSSSTETRDSRLIRDEIIVYAAGYVDDYKLEAQQVVGNQTQVKMKVWVSHNKLANRLLGESRADGAVEGNRISEQIRSFQNTRKTGDQLVAEVLRDFPKRAFDVRMDKTRTRIDDNRVAWVDVGIFVAWDPEFIKSMQEVMKAIKHRDDCNSFWYDCDAQGIVEIKDRWGFDDTKALKVMFDQMIVSRPTLLLKLKDNTGRTVYQDCYAADDFNPLDNNYGFIQWYNTKITLVHDKRSRMKLSFSSNQVPVDQLDSAQVEVVRISSCPTPPRRR